MAYLFNLAAEILPAQHFISQNQNLTGTFQVHLYLKK